ncbi:MAG: hypothetical protein N2037_01055 [Acidimicrobiales bacterium]|nr:hypothetical protein [Acidimicrobiales bacterium]
MLAFLCFLLFAVQLLVGLHGRSVITNVALAGAHRAAGARVDQTDPTAVAAARADAEAHMRQLLGQQATRTTFDWSASNSDEIVLRVQARLPRFLFPGVGGRLGTDTVERTIQVRVERPR